MRVIMKRDKDPHGLVFSKKTPDGDDTGAETG